MEKNKGRVRFIRRGGRVIPIRGKGNTAKDRRKSLSAGAHGKRWLLAQAVSLPVAGLRILGHVNNRPWLAAAGQLALAGTGLYAGYHGLMGIYKGVRGLVRKGKKN